MFVCGKRKSPLVRIDRIGARSTMKHAMYRTVRSRAFHSTRYVLHVKEEIFINSLVCARARLVIRQPGGCPIVNMTIACKNVI